MRRGRTREGAFREGGTEGAPRRHGLKGAVHLRHGNILGLVNIDTSDFQTLQ